MLHSVVAAVAYKLRFPLFVASFVFVSSDFDRIIRCNAPTMGWRFTIWTLTTAALNTITTRTTNMYSAHPIRDRFEEKMLNIEYGIRQTEWRASVCGKQATSQPSDLSKHKRNTFTCLSFRFAACGLNKSNIWTSCWLQFSISSKFFVCTHFALRKHFNGVLMSFSGKYTEWIVCNAQQLVVHKLAHQRTIRPQTFWETFNIQLFFFR